MRYDSKLELDESHRLAQHEAAKDLVRKEVQAEIAGKTDLDNSSDQAQLHSAAEGLKHKAIGEITDTETELSKARKIARISQVIDYVFYLIYGIIGLEIILELLGARDSNAFKQMLDALARPLLAPFKGLMPTPAIGPFQFMLSYIAGLVIYLLIHMAINGLLRLFVDKKSNI
ncbi:MAG: hypothetical protein AB1489_04420 [Acidobacteriota bacterium]